MIKIIIIFLSVMVCGFSHAKETLVIDISGVEGDALNNIEARLEAEEASYSDGLNPTDIENFHKEAQNFIKKALEPYGYINSEISSHLSHDHSLWHAEYRIKKGPPLIIKKIEVTASGSGASNERLRSFIDHFPLKANQKLVIDRYNKAKETFFEIVNDEGYLKAHLDKKEILIDKSNNTASIVLNMNTGPQFYFGKMYFNDSAYSTRFLQRFNPIEEGSPFSSLKLLQFQHDLSSSRFFKNVMITPEFDKAYNGKIPTKVDISLPKSQQYNIGIGYGTFTGPRLTLGTDIRRIGDMGQHLTAQLKLSSVLSGLSAKYYIPGGNPLTDQYTIGLNIQRFLPKNGESLSEALSAGYLKQLGLWHHTISFNALNDLYQENDTDPRNSHLLYPSYNISRIAADDIINPRLGTSLNLTIQASSKNMLSTTSFFQTELKGKYLLSPTKYSKLILRSNIGYTIVNDLSQLPLTLNFFAGGINSVRGYPFDSIGPGRYLRVGSVEFQHKIIGDFSGAAFYDFGNASDHFNDPLKRGDGLGIIYQSMIGPIKLYAGRAESKKDKPYSIEFSIGPEF